GTATSTGTVAGSSGSFTVTGSHTYATYGNFSIGVTINGPGAGSGVQDTSPAVVNDAALTADEASLDATAGHAFTNQVLTTFTDDNAGAAASDFTVTIDW